MKAIIQDRYGSPNRLRIAEMPKPEAGDREVLVRVRAASLHPDVWHVVVGQPLVLRLFGTGLLRPKNPIPGTDMAGVVESAGKAVTRFEAGDEVFGETLEAQWWANGGAFAEFVAVPEVCLEHKPDNVSFQQAASVASSGFIAVNNLPEATRLEGKEVLINGAGGGVGAIALQIVKSYGATVTAVDSTGKLEMLRNLGADHVIDFTRDDFTRGEQRYDFIFDVPGNHSLSSCRSVLSSKGRYITIGYEYYGKAGRRIFGLIPYFFYLILRSRFDPHLGTGRPFRPERREIMILLRSLLEAGKLTPIIDSSYPLSEIDEAFRHLIEDELHGKVLLSI